DGWSMGLILREVCSGYGARRRGAVSAPSQPTMHYADFALWQRSWLCDAALDRLIGYWREHLAGAPQSLELLWAKPRPAKRNFARRAYKFVVPAATCTALRARARDCDTTLFVCVLAAYAMVISRLAGAADVVIGAPIAGRSDWQVEAMIGFFVNILPLR